MAQEGVGVGVEELGAPVAVARPARDRLDIGRALLAVDPDRIGGQPAQGLDQARRGMVRVDHQNRRPRRQLVLERLDHGFLIAFARSLLSVMCTGTGPPVSMTLGVSSGRERLSTLGPALSCAAAFCSGGTGRRGG